MDVKLMKSLLLTRIYNKDNKKLIAGSFTKELNLGIKKWDI